MLKGLEEKDRLEMITREEQKRLDAIQLNEELAKFVELQKKKKKTQFQTSSLVKHSNSITPEIPKAIISKTPQIKINKFDRKEMASKNVKK